MIELQRMWSAARIMRKAIDAPMVALAASVDVERAKEQLEAWQHAGHLRIVTDGDPGFPTVYRIIGQPGRYAPGTPQAEAERLAAEEAASRRYTSWSRVWDALRVARVATAEDISLQTKVPLSTARDAIGLLRRAGYVEIVTRGNRKPGEANRFRLVRDTGPIEPKRCFDTLIDGNTHTVQKLAPARPNGQRAAQRARRAERVAA